jgi:hypothetical protein
MLENNNNDFSGDPGWTCASGIRREPEGMDETSFSTRPPTGTQDPQWETTLPGHTRSVISGSDNSQSLHQQYPGKEAGPCKNPEDPHRPQLDRVGEVDELVGKLCDQVMRFMVHEYTAPERIVDLQLHLLGLVKCYSMWELLFTQDTDQAVKQGKVAPEKVQDWQELMDSMGKQLSRLNHDLDRYIPLQLLPHSIAQWDEYFKD